MMQLTEDDRYYFDEKAAERPVTFVERFCRHFEDKWAGQPFLLLEWQKKIVRDLFGWKRRDNNLRRFRELYLEVAKGAGKSPLLAAIGLYMLFADGEPGAHIISAATDYAQANCTFESAKKMIEQSPKLAALADIKQFRIDAPSNSKWTIISGTAEGRSGDRPTCLLMDEAHEWPNRKLYSILTKNAKKRSQPLILVATNAGHSKDSICWELHERAAKVLAGTSKDDTLYPVIYCADEKDDPSSPATWKKANPALDIIIRSETLRDEWAIAQEHPAYEADFRRLHLSQWVQGTQKLLDMSAWDKCTRPFGPGEVKDLPLIVGLDMSLNDDLTALAMIWQGENLYAKARFWLPRATAHEYEDRNGIPFTQWASEKAITLIDSQTIDPPTQARIARSIIKLRDKYDLRAVCYDRARASAVIKQIEDAGITCVPVEQTWKLSPAIEEMIRRLKDRSIIIRPNPVLRWNAANVEGAYDRKHNLHLMKEARKGSYKGRSSAKIDGVQALVTALHQVRLEQLQPTAKRSIYEDRGVLIF